MLYRGVVHLHSRHSYDSVLSLEEIRKACLSKGYSFACLTEHAEGFNPEKMRLLLEDCRRWSDERFLFIPGLEIPYQETHALAIGLQTFDSILTPLMNLRSAKEQGAWIVLAHPHRHGFVIDDQQRALIQAVEIWNVQYDGRYFPRAGSVAWLRKLRLQSAALSAVGGLDLHRLSHLGGPWLEVEAGSLESGAIIRSLHQGDYLIKSRLFTFDSKRNPEFGPCVMIWAGGQIFGSILSVLKRSNAFLVKHRIRIPGRFKELLRRWL